MRVPDRQLIWHVRLTPPIKSSKLWGIPAGSTTCRQAPFRERLRIVQSKTDDFWLKTIFPDFRVRRRGSCRCSSIRRLPKRHVRHPFYAQTVTGFLTNFAGCRHAAATTLGGGAFRKYSSLTLSDLCAIFALQFLLKDSGLRALSAASAPISLRPIGSHPALPTPNIAQNRVVFRFCCGAPTASYFAVSILSPRQAATDMSNSGGRLVF